MKKDKLISVIVCILFFTIILNACNSKQEGSSLRDQIKNMTQEIAMDSQVQRSFLKGRQETVQSDGKLRKEIFFQNLREQRGMLEDPQIGPELVDFNLDVTEQALDKERFLRGQIQAMEKIAQTPNQRNQLLTTLQDAHKEAMKDQKMRLLLLQGAIDDQYRALKTPVTASRILQYNMDVTERVLKDPKQKKRMMRTQMELMRSVAADPELRPQLIMLMIQLMKDPAMQKEMQKMMQPMIKMMEQKMKQQIQQQMQQKQMPQQKNSTPSTDSGETKREGE